MNRAYIPIPFLPCNLKHCTQAAFLLHAGPFLGCSLCVLPLDAPILCIPHENVHYNDNYWLPGHMHMYFASSRVGLLLALF